MSRRTAIVMRSTGSGYTLRDTADGTLTESVIRGRLRLKGIRSTNPVAVGDVVDYEVDEHGLGAITTIHPRRNYIIRRSPNLSKESHIIAANLDRACLVVTLFAPETSVEFIDRFLVTCEAYRIPATIVINKIDMVRAVAEAQEVLDDFRNTYTLAGYPIMEVSAATGDGIEELEALLKDKTTLLAGNSGVGKSTLIKRLDPSAEVRTGEISDYHHKGKHTTTFAQMYTLPGGGDIIDTPGIKGFGLLEIKPEELYQYFPEMMQAAKDCRFYNCTHLHEPGCAVQAAVAEGDISESRYVSYLKILEEDEKYRK